MCAGRCPADPESAAEEFVIGRMAPNKALRFAAHVAICASCAARVGKEFSLQKLMNAAVPAESGNAAPTRKTRSSTA